jgi:hypothetical protein
VGGKNNLLEKGKGIGISEVHDLVAINSGGPSYDAIDGTHYFADIYFDGLLTTINKNPHRE